MGTCTAETDRRNWAKHKEIGQHVAAFHHMEKGKKKREMKMKVQKGWPYDVATRNSTKQQVTIKVSATRATLLYSQLLSTKSDEEFRRLTCWCFCVLSRGIT